MGDINQVIYLRKVMPQVDGPVQEIGSKDYGSENNGPTSSFRTTYPGVEYIGADLEDGKGVDVVVDLCAGTDPLPREHFALVICCSVMEHVRRPWIMAENITSLVRPGGRLYISVPWVWRYHPYPDDFFRFSWRGIAEIFPGFEWRHAVYSTTVPNEFFPIDPGDPTADNKLALVGNTDAGQRKYLPYLNVNMIGTRR